jgi:hypothetical protein
MSSAGAAADESPLQRLRRETSLGKGSDFAEILPKLVLHRGWHRLNSEHVRFVASVPAIHWQRTLRLTSRRNPAHVRTH